MAISSVAARPHCQVKPQHHLFRLRTSNQPLADGEYVSIFGVLCNNEKWEPIAKEAMMRSYSFDGYGRPLKPEKGVTFIQISKPIRYTA